MAHLALKKDDYVVGSTISVKDILGVSMKCNSFFDLRFYWMDLLKRLQMPSEFLDRIAAIEKHNSNVSTLDIFETVLEKWIQCCGPNTSLNILINALRECGLEEIGAALNQELMQKNSDNVKEITTKQNWILDVLEVLVELTQYNKQLRSKLLERQIICQSDVEKLESITEPDNQIANLYLIIHDKLSDNPGIYDQLILSLDDLYQFGASSLLKEIHEQ